MVSSIFPKNEQKKFDFTTVRHVFIRFLKEFGDIKRHFEINWLDLAEEGDKVRILMNFQLKHVPTNFNFLTYIEGNRP